MLGDATRIRQIAAGGANTTCVLRDDVCCFILGHGVEDCTRVEIGGEIETLTSDPVSGVFCVSRVDDSPVCWSGLGPSWHGTVLDPYELTTPDGSPLPNVLAPGWPHERRRAGVCAIDDTGRVSCWGANFEGELGDGAAAHSECRIRYSDAGPWTVDCSMEPVTVAGLESVVDLAVASAGRCALRDDHTVWCWGAEPFVPAIETDRRCTGFVGGGPYPPSIWSRPCVSTPRLLSIPPIVELSGGAGHICGLTTAGGVVCWGINNASQISGPSVPSPVTGRRGSELFGSGLAIVFETGIRGVSTGPSHTCALSDRGEIWCWGLNDLQQIDDSGDRVVEQPRMVGPAGSVSAVATGSGHTCALVSNDVVCWGGRAR